MQTLQTRVCVRAQPCLTAEQHAVCLICFGSGGTHVGAPLGAAGPTWVRPYQARGPVAGSDTGVPAAHTNAAVRRNPNPVDFVASFVSDLIRSQVLRRS